MSAVEIQIQTDPSGSPVFYFHSASSKQPVKVPLVEGRRQGIGTKNDLLFRALGRKKSGSVLDLTAGLLRDSLHMVQLGYDVTAVERDDRLAKALADYLKEHPIERLELVHADSFIYLAKLERKVDIIYIDPMFPDLGGSALSGKESQLLKALVGSGDEAESSELLKLALTKSSGRVVVKRPRKSALLLPKPKAQVIGKSTRYDIY